MEEKKGVKMFLLYLGWLLVVPLLMLWHQKTKLEVKVQQAMKEAEEGKEFLKEVQSLTEEITRLKVRESEIETMLKAQEKAYEEKLQFLGETKEKFGEAFKALSFEVMEKMQEKSDKEIGKKEEELLKKMQPVRESLLKLDEGMRLIEKERKGEQAAMKEQIQAMLNSEKELRNETLNLVNALRKPDVRGMWGELQLKRVVELAGMINYCDFFEQNVIQEGDTRVRPDLIVKLPGDKQVIVDAKVPFQAFLEANQTEDPEVKLEKLKDHARHVRNHVSQLSKKSYWRHFQPSPEFVVLFLPAEIFFQAALQQDPSLIEMSAEQGVIIATPTTMIGLLRAIAHGWKQDVFSKNAMQISEIGHELYRRLNDMNKHWLQMGKSLTSAVDHYNKALGSFERRVLVSARRFKELGAGDNEVELLPLPLIDATTRTPEPAADETI